MGSALLAPVIGIAAYSRGWLGDNTGPAEMKVLRGPGTALLLGHWSHVFEYPAVQAGPWELATFGVAGVLHIHTAAGWMLYYSVGIFLLTILFTWAILTAARPTTRVHPVYLAAAAGALASLLGLLLWAFDAGHPAQVVIPCLWVMAGVAARRRRFGVVGVVLGIAAGWEVWGVLGAPVVLLVARPDLIRAAWTGLIAVLVTYGPFVATRHFEMFQFAWPVSAGSFASQVAHMTSFPWSLRVLQAALALALGSVTAITVRKRELGLWLTILMILTVRLALDPCMYGYYWIAPALMAIGGLAVAWTRRAWRLAGTFVVLVGWYSTPPSRTFVGTCATLLALALSIALLARSAGEVEAAAPASVVPAA